ncbi:MAG: hypothetical protein RL226_102, partial [Bacteroidota bacterium]
MMSDQPTFHLGITLAGAVSAGCYTAGVLDYLFETFDLWEQAKAGSLEGIQNTALVPRHNVVIEAIGGASAGGMCASMAVLHAMNPQRKPVSTPLNTPQKRNNIFYDSWVLLDDDQRETFAKLMDVSDLQSGKVTSLLNSKPIDSIAERAFQVSGALRLDTLPAYIASDLEVLLSVTMLRGLPLEVDFRTPIRARAKKGRYSPSHITWEHYTLAHFKLSDADARRKGYLWLNPFDAEARALMLKCTIATGAFPIGLKFRKFEASDFPVDYLKEVAERIVFSRFGDEAHHTDIEQVREQIRMEFQPLELPKKSQDKLERLLDGLPGSANELANYAADKMDSAENVVAALSDLPDHIDWERLKDDFSFTAVDGGVINNEPFGEVLKLIKNKFEHENENEHQSYGVIMVDPFPDRMDREKSEQDEPYKHPDDLFGVAGKLIK